MHDTAPAGARSGRGRRHLFASLALAAAVALAGCGDDDDAGATEGTESPSDDSTRDRSDGASGEGGPPAEEPGGVPGVDVAAASGGAPAAAGAGLDEPPGDPDRVPLDGFGEGALAVTAPDGTTTGWCVLLALAAAQRQQGLMEVTDLGGYDGMVFAFPDDTETGFWMSNTPMPLSIGWFDAAGELVSTTDMEPCPEGDDCPTYPPAGPYRFALEVPQGELATLGVEPGSRLAIGGPCA